MRGAGRRQLRQQPFWRRGGPRPGEPPPPVRARRGPMRPRRPPHRAPRPPAEARSDPGAPLRPPEGRQGGPEAAAGEDGPPTTWAQPSPRGRRAAGGAAGPSPPPAGAGVNGERGGRSSGPRPQRLFMRRWGRGRLPSSGRAAAPPGSLLLRAGLLPGEGRALASPASSIGAWALAKPLHSPWLCPARGLPRIPSRPQAVGVGQGWGPPEAAGSARRGAGRILRPPPHGCVGLGSDGLAPGQDGAPGWPTVRRGPPFPQSPARPRHPQCLAVPQSWQLLPALDSIGHGVQLGC